MSHCEKRRRLRHFSLGDFAPVYRQASRRKFLRNLFPLARHENPS